MSNSPATGNNGGGTAVESGTIMAEQLFGTKFYQKLFKLTTTNTEEARAQLQKLHETTKAYYVKYGITSLFGDQEVNNGDESASTERVKRHEKVVAPVKKDPIKTNLDPPSTTVGGRNAASAGNSPCPSPSRTPPKGAKKLREVDLFGDLTDLTTTTVDREKRDVDHLKEPTKRKPEVESGELKVKKRSKMRDKERHTSGESPQHNANNSDSCTTCKRLVIESGNTLVQCNQCNQLVHQKCHEPPVRSEELRDPRFIFTCGTCAKKRAKLAATAKSPGTMSTITPNISLAASVTKESTTARQPGGTDVTSSAPTSDETNRTMRPPSFFRGVNATAVTVVNKEQGFTALKTSSPTSGLSSAMADFLAKRGAKQLPKPTSDSPTSSAQRSPSSGQPSSSSLKGTPSSVSTQMESAERRLLAMKKKAAAKNKAPF